MKIDKPTLKKSQTLPSPLTEIVTGSLGHISKPLTASLTASGHQVTVISSNENKKEEIEKLKAVAAIGNLEDVHFLTDTFNHVDAVAGEPLTRGIPKVLPITVLGILFPSKAILQRKISGL